MSSTVGAGAVARIFGRSDRPSRSGRLMSHRTRSNGRRPTAASPAAAVSATSTSWPARPSTSPQRARMPRSSSMTRIAAIAGTVSRDRDGHAQLGSAAGGVVDLDRAAPGRDQVLAHREAEAGAGAGLLAGHERIEDALAIGDRD